MKNNWPAKIIWSESYAISLALQIFFKTFQEFLIPVLGMLIKRLIQLEQRKLVNILRKLYIAKTGSLC